MYQKVKVLLLLLSLSPLWVFSQFKIEGEAPSWLNGEMVYLFYLDKNISLKPVLKDSTVIKKRSFSFSGELAEPLERVVFGIKDKKGQMRTSRGIIEQGLNRAILKVVPVSVSEFFYVDMPDSRPSELIKKLNAVESRAFASYREGRIVKGDLRLPEEETRKIHLQSLEVLKANPSDYISLRMLYEFSQYRTFLDEPELLLSTLESLDPLIRSSALGLSFKQELEYASNEKNHIQSKNPVPQFNVNTSEGTIFKNSDLAGSPYVLAFSAAWSRDATSFLPALQKIYNQYKNQGLNVVYFNLDDNKIRWQGMIERYMLDWINVSEETVLRDSKIAKQFHVRDIPAYLVVDKNGIIVFNSTFSKDYADELEGVVKTVLK